MGNKGGFSLLFDLSFSEFITTKVIKVLFVVFIVLSVLGTLGIVVSAFTASVMTGIIALIFSPVVFLLYVLFARIWCELIMVIFRIAENTSGLRGREDAGASVPEENA